MTQRGKRKEEKERKRELLYTMLRAVLQLTRVRICVWRSVTVGRGIIMPSLASSPAARAAVAKNQVSGYFPESATFLHTASR